MLRKLKKMIGAYVPKEYELEIYDKLQKQYPGTPLSALVRALIGMWFDGKIKITSKDLRHYRMDGRKYTLSGNGNQPRLPIEQGYYAAKQGMPAMANPYEVGTSEANAWHQGWNNHFSTQEGK